MSSIQELLERYRRGPELVATVVTGAAGSELDFTPGAGKWSVRQIVAHLADSEIVISDRIRRIIAEDNPTLINYDQDAWAARLNWSKRKISEAMETFRHLRGENHQLLKSQAEDAWARVGTHNVRGRMTLLDLVTLIASHDENHARQIRQARDAYKQVRQAHA